MMMRRVCFLCCLVCGFFLFVSLETQGVEIPFSAKPVIDSTLNLPAHSQPIDFDFDGDIDVVVGDKSNNRLLLYVNDGKEGFTPQLIKDGITTPTSFKVIDFDFDGDYDVVTNLVNANKVGWLENDGV